MKKDTFTYLISDRLYVNLTNRCTNECTFCVREGKEEYEGYSLWLSQEPTAEQVIAEIGDPKKYREVVFCGFGEPTERLGEMLEICRAVHKEGGKTRLNTNGHGSAIAGRDIAPLLKGNLDAINVSLNAPDAERYEKLCRPRIPNAFEEMKNFAKSCKREGLNVWFSVVDCIGGEQVALCRRLCEEMGIFLRVREMIR